MNNERLYRTVLAEEVGHYRTTIGDITPRRYMYYRDRIYIDKQELLALKWATNFLIPTDALLDAIRSKDILTMDEFIDDFYITHEFMMHKLEFMSKKQGMWSLGDDRYLYLYNLPSVHIFNSISQ